MSLRASTIRINARMDYKVGIGYTGAEKNIRLRDLIDVDDSTADEPNEDNRFLVYNATKGIFEFSNVLDGNTDNNVLDGDIYDF